MGVSNHRHEGLQSYFVFPSPSASGHLRQYFAAVSDAEKGKSSTGIVVYTALLWAYDLLGPMQDLADPARDEEGLSLELSSGRARARAMEELDSGF